MTYNLNNSFDLLICHVALSWGPVLEEDLKKPQINLEFQSADLSPPKKTFYSSWHNPTSVLC